MLSAADRIELREAEYVSLRARYGENHPDVRRMRKEIELLRGSSPTLLAAEQEGARELENLRAERAVLRQRYSSEHPDVRSIERKIAAVEAAWSERAGAARAGPGESPDNPVYVQLKARLDATSADLAALQAQRKVLRAKLLEFEQHITAAPQVEREYRSLTRDYEVAITEYQNVLAKKQQAEIAQSLESGQKGERFTLIEPPVVPEAPERPNRPVIGLLGVMLSVLGSIGFGAITEALDDRVFGRRGVMRVTGVQPLAVIPLLESAGARARRGRRRLLWLGGVVATVVCVAIVLHVMVRPLDVLFFRALRVLGW
jgi:uncharacterized protein involved in exopolysaccharide biosynthesis